MSKKPTKAEIQESLRLAEQNLYAYQEAFWALQRGEKPVRLESGGFAVLVLGAGRACGGVTLTPDGMVIKNASRWAGEAASSYNPYVRDLAQQVVRLQARELARAS